MKEIKVCDFVDVTGADLVFGDKNETMDCFKKDTREIKLGDTYVGINGEKFNRESFL